MNIELIVGEIDAEIEKLQGMRAILEKLLTPQSRTSVKPRPARVQRSPHVEPASEPRLVILPPKQQRVYTRRVKPVVIEPKALAAPVSHLPVFVPKAAVSESQAEKAAEAESNLEAVMRRKLLSGAA